MSSRNKQRFRYLFAIIGTFLLVYLCLFAAFTGKPSTLVFVSGLLGAILGLILITLNVFLLVTLSKRNKSM